ILICSYAVIHFDRKDTKSNRCTRKISATNYISIISKNTWRFLVDSNEPKKLTNQSAEGLHGKAKDEWKRKAWVEIYEKILYITHRPLNKVTMLTGIRLLRLGR
ncbi:MAG: hypothetical protein IJ762_00095, partial [Bacteroidaceae bacterium]|nr:hypothetical protein [Bacteroidaceae bacterium]